MTEIIDQYNDPSFIHLHVLTRDKPLARTMLKNASFEKTAGAALPSSAFAWPDRRRFPVHTKEDALASLLYRQKCASIPAEVDAALNKAASVYRIGHEVFSSVKTAGEVTRTYVFEDSQRLPLDTPDEVKLAEHVLNRDFERLPLEKRATAYQKLTDAAQTHDVSLRPFTERMAGMVACSVDSLRDALETRATAAGPGKYREAFDKMASALSKAPPLLQTREDLLKLAGAIHTLDQGADLEKHYDRKLTDPVQTVFNTNIKLAEEMCDVAGQPVPCSQLMALPPAIWEQLDLPEMIKCCEENDMVTFKQVFDTLPLDMKVALKAYL